ncbi:MAG: hypothetical protein HYR75_04345 [Gemmatimonadetes bacterium]|nr:hypothetical protein [Gemmatimonadota bacterium]
MEVDERRRQLTTDGGKTFTSTVNNLPKDSPADYLHVIREDPYNKDLLFVGSSLSAYASLDRGKTWTKFASNLPSVPVFDLKIHPRDHELIAATHGRSFWIVDIAPLEQLNDKVVTSAAHLFAPKTAYQWGEGPTLAGGGNGNAHGMFSTPSPQYGAEIKYRVGAAGAGSPAKITITDAMGDVLATLTGPGAAGLHTVVWNFQGTRSAVTAPLSASERRDSILKAVRGPKVHDSLAAAKYDSAALARVKAILNPPAGGGGRGGRGGGRGAGGANCYQPLTQWETFCARPGEGPLPRAGGPGAGEQPFGGGRGGAEPANVVKVLQLIGIKPPMPAGRGGFFGFGGAGGFTAGTGDYLVTLTIGGTTLKQKLHVERVSGGDDNGSPFGEERDDRREPRSH